MNTQRADVVITGGGLAGLSLALQLKQRDPALAITVLERRAHPVREAAFKVGESTVEIGAHYFADVLGLREHLETEQIRKFGFRFFFSDQRHDIDRCTELGVSKILPRRPGRSTAAVSRIFSARARARRASPLSTVAASKALNCLKTTPTMQCASNAMARPAR